MTWRRIGLVAVFAAAVLGGLMPHTVAVGAENTGTAMIQIAEAPLPFPTTCTEATCGKGTPTPAAPTPAVALAAVLTGLAAATVGAGLIRRRAVRFGTLPSGRPDPLLRPPQFS